ncbi:OLC1v1031895C2 [Oldenlandia corymbosa var. corymbosa]|uniref:OLC1v1031895C2 n=1 Tax=Oldenlandia corymbosa var. corymbosa TaxID=529605 RepID=A0AAV1CKH7_OLDCO|nr:OLC1v1031895C2 [Oldenlandia corymbosa var. corymbosa]
MTGKVGPGYMEPLADLERTQTRILQRITDLELTADQSSDSFPLSSSSSCSAGAGAADDTSTTEGRLSAILRSKGVRDFSFKRVPSDYYDWTLEARRDVLGAASIHHICKSIVLVNNRAPAHVTDCSDRNNSKYYVAIVQYTARFNAEFVKNFLYELNNGQISKKKFNSELVDVRFN